MYVYLFMYQRSYRYVNIWILNIFYIKFMHIQYMTTSLRKVSTQKINYDSYSPKCFSLKSEHVKSQVWLNHPHKVLQRRNHDINLMCLSLYSPTPTYHHLSKYAWTYFPHSNFWNQWKINAPEETIHNIRLFWKVQCC